MCHQEPRASCIEGETVGSDTDIDLVNRREIIVAKIPTVFSPRFDVRTRSGLLTTSAPATAVSPAMEPTYFCAEMSMTSTASFAVCATKIRPVGSWTAA